MPLVLQKILTSLFDLNKKGPNDDLVFFRLIINFDYLMTD